MKRRFLAGLLAFVMLLGCVPAMSIGVTAAEPESAENAEAIVPVEAEETAPVITEETVPVIAEETVPVIAEETAPVITEETVPVITEETVPVITEETVPVIAEETAPVITEETIPVIAEETIPVITEETIPVITEETVPVIAEETVPVITEETVPVIAEETVPVIAEETVPVTIEETGETNPVSGTCGDNLTWVLDEVGTLTISGTGDMWDFSAESPAPWYGVRERILEAVIEDGVTRIGDYAFSDCAGLANVTFPEGIAIGDEAFAGCASLTELTLPAHLTPTEPTEETEPETTWEAAVEGMAAMNALAAEDTVVVSGTCGENVTWTLDEAGTLTISGTGAMENYSRGSATPWYNEWMNAETKSVVISDGVTSIGDYAFSSSIITSVSIPDSVTSIGNYAFSGSSLPSVSIPNSVTSIGDSAFCYCELTNVTIPESVTSMGAGAFALDRNLTGIWVAESNPSFCNDSNGILFNKDKSVLMQAPATMKGAYVIPGTVSSINDCAFSGCGLTSVEIPSGVTRIGEGAFLECGDLTSVNISDGVTSIGNHAFQACSDLTSINIPASVTSIGIGAFLWCYGLTSVTIPASVTSIDCGAFSDCRNLSVITFEGDAPTFGNATYGNAVFDDNVTATAYYPANNDTWTEEVRQNCGGNITWVEKEALTSEDTKTEEDSTAPTSFAFDRENRTVYLVDDTVSYYLSYSYQPYGAVLSIVEVASSDPTVLEVYSSTSGYGYTSISCKAIKVGTATVTATTANGLTASCTVTVKEPEVISCDESVTLESEDVYFYFVPSEDGNYAFSTTEGCYADFWDGESYSDHGTNLKAGERYTVRVSCYYKTGTFSVKKEVPVERIQICDYEPITEYTGSLGETVQLRIESEPEWARIENYSWTVSDPSIAYITDSTIYLDGEHFDVTFLKAGTATITATSESGASASCVVTVNELTPLEEIHPGEEKILASTYAIGTGNKMFTFTPEESGAYIVIMESNTNFSCTMEMLESGVLLSSASYNNAYQATCSFEAEAEKTNILRIQWDSYSSAILRIERAVSPTGMQLSQRNHTGYVGEAFDLYAQFEPENAIRQDVAWSSSDPSVATVDGTGHVTVLSNGSADITATSSGGFTASCTVQATAPTSFEFVSETRTAYLPRTGVVSLEYSFQPRGTREPIVSVVSSDPSVLDVRVDSYEIEHIIFTPFKVGTVTVTASTASGLSDSCTVTVKEVGEISCDVPVTMTLAPFDYAYFTFNPPEPGNYNVFSEDNFWLTLMSKEIYGTYGWISGTCTLEVYNQWDATREVTVCIKEQVPVESVQLGQYAYSGYDVLWQEMQQYEETLSNTFTLNAKTFPLWALDEEITWTVSDESVVSIQGAYNYRKDVTPLKPGTATITATSESGASASCVVTVKAPEMISLGESKTITLANQEEKQFLFIPETTGDYVFHLPIDEYVSYDDTGRGYIMDFSLSIYQDGAQIGTEVYNGNWSGQYARMEAGKVYLLRVGNYLDAEVTVTGTVSLEALQRAESIAFDPIYAPSRVYVGENNYYGLIIAPEKAYAVGCTWTSSDPTVLELDGSFGKDAIFTGVQPGTATVTVTTDNGVSASWEVTVEEREEIHAGDSKTITLEYGEVKQYSFIPEVTGEYVFHSRDYAIMDIREDGFLIGEDVYNTKTDDSGCYASMTAGKEYILCVSNGYYTKEDITATVLLSEYQAPESITIERREAHSYVAAGGDLWLWAGVAPEASFARNCQWSSSDPEVLKVEDRYHYVSDSMLFVAGKPGTATITVTANGLTASRTFTVKEVTETEYTVLDIAQEDTLTVHVDGEMDMFAYVLIRHQEDPEEEYSFVDPSNYTLTQGSTIVTLHQDYLDTLPDGQYELDIQFFDGDCKVSFTLGETQAVTADINEDGAINVDDVFYLAMHISAPSVFAIPWKNADANGDGAVNVDDVFYLAMHISAPQVFSLFPNT